MPQATDLVIKNAAGVDKTFKLITPAAGDGGVAEWALKEGTISSVFPRLTASAVRSKNRARKLRTKTTLPASWTDAVTGLTNVGSRAEFNAEVTIPDDLPEVLKDDFVAFATNFFKTALVQAMIRDALPAT